MFFSEGKVREKYFLNPPGWVSLLVWCNPSFRSGLHAHEWFLFLHGHDFSLPFSPSSPPLFCCPLVSSISLFSPPNCLPRPPLDCSIVLYWGVWPLSVHSLWKPPRAIEVELWKMLHGKLNPFTKSCIYFWLSFLKIWICMCTFLG